MSQTNIECDKIEEQSSFLNEADGSIEEKDVSYPGRKDLEGPIRGYKRLQKDTVFRHRFVHTIVLCWTLFPLGWATGMTGPTFPDIRLIINKDLDTASWYFTTAGLGYLVGALASGSLYDRCNKILLLMTASLGLALGTAVIPWCSLFALMMVVRFLGGAFAGVLDAAGNADIIHVWGSESGPYMQAFHFAFSAGGILSPFATEPYLVEKSCIHGNTSYSDLKSIDIAVVTVNSTETVLGNASACRFGYGETKVHYAFVLSGCLFLVPSILFVFLYFWARNKAPYVASATETQTAATCTSSGIKLTRKLKGTFVCLLATLLMTYCIYEDTIFSFLMTFCISYLKWSKSDGSYITAVSWITFAVGRLLGIFIVQFCNHGLLLSISLTATLGSFVGLFISSIFHIEYLQWMFVGIVGLAMSVFVPCLMSWTSTNILKVSGKISAIFLTVASGGSMVFPLLVGYLMDNASPIWFNILLLIMSGIAVGLFAAVVCLKRVFLSTEEVEVVIEVPCQLNSTTNFQNCPSLTTPKD